MLYVVISLVKIKKKVENLYCVVTAAADRTDAAPDPPPATACPPDPSSAPAPVLPG